MRSRKWGTAFIMPILAATIGTGLFLGGKIPVQADAEKKTVKVAVIDYPNYLQMEPDGSVYGLAYEYLQKIKEYTGWQYDFIEMSFTDATAAIKAGEIDILPGCQYTQKREKECDFSESSMGQGGTVLCTLLDNQDYRFNDYAGYEGMRISCLKGSARIKQTQELFDRYGTHVIMVEYETDEACKKALEDGKVDAVMMSSIRCEKQYKIIARMKTTPLYFMLNQEKPELKTQIDQAMNQIIMESPYYILELDRRYYGNMQTEIPLTKEEADYVDQAAGINIALFTDMRPMEYYDETAGKFRGIVPDSLEQISAYTGLKFHYIAREDASKLCKQLEDDTIQAVGAVTASSAQGTMPVRLTDRFYTNTVTAVMNNTLTAYETDGCTASIAGTMPELVNALDAMRLQNVVCQDDLKSCVEAVNNGEYDLTLIPTYCVDDIINHSYYRKLMTYPLPDSGYAYYIGVAEGTDPRLCTVLNKGIAAISEEDHNAMVVNNLINSQKPDTIRDLIYQNLYLVFGLLVFFLGIIAIAAIVVLLIRTDSNKKMRLAMKQAQAASEAKSDFLTRMSHDMRTPMNAVLGFTRLAQAEKDVPDHIRDYLQKIDVSGTHLLKLLNDILNMTKIEQGRIQLQEEKVNIKEFLQNVTKAFEAQAVLKDITLNIHQDSVKTEWIYMDEGRARQIYSNLLSNAIQFSDKGSEICWNVTELPGEDGKATFISEIIDHGCGMS
ncbi:MAG: transporter substrate-binding domain-containing protein [Lachnospiraceae bacterium]|nr:transporter substrate-binding domain-containing protein [Lachnospiraceae bacterium]